MNENYRTARPVSKSFILSILFILSKSTSDRGQKRVLGQDLQDLQDE
jgi:hypothetical protein